MDYVIDYPEKATIPYIDYYIVCDSGFTLLKEVKYQDTKKCIITICNSLLDAPVEFAIQSKVESN
jgi:hypothetical protein